VLDVRLPGPSGLDLQRELANAEKNSDHLHTGHGDIPMTVRAHEGPARPNSFQAIPRAGAVLDAVRTAIVRDRAARDQWAELAQIRDRYEDTEPRANAR